MKNKLFPVALFLILLCIAATTKYVGNFSGDGSLITGLNGTQITSGTVNDARLSGNIPRLGSVNAFGNNNSFAANAQFDGGINVGPASSFTNSVIIGSPFSISSTNVLEVWTLQYGVKALNVATNGITNLRQVTGGQTNLAGATVIDWSTGTDFYDTIAANRVFTFINAVDTETIAVTIVGDASHTVTWPAVNWFTAGVPVQGLSKTNIYMFHQVNGALYGTYVQ